MKELSHQLGGVIFKIELQDNWFNLKYLYFRLSYLGGRKGKRQEKTTESIH